MKTQDRTTVWVDKETHDRLKILADGRPLSAFLSQVSQMPLAVSHEKHLTTNQFDMEDSLKRIETTLFDQGSSIAAIEGVLFSLISDKYPDSEDILKVARSIKAMVTKVTKDNELVRPILKPLPWYDKR